MTAFLEWLLQSKPETIAAFMSFGAALAAAIATWQAPRSAARISEEMRLLQDKQNEQRRMRLHVFVTLMQERATIASLDSVRVLNVIDFVYADCPKVREAWADLFQLFGSGGDQGIHPQLQQEKLRTLLKTMADELGLSHTLGVDDLSRIYYPNIIAKQQELTMLQQELNLRQLRATIGPGASSDDIQKRFPPKPGGNQQ
jgi:Family of unknown function (DUF6680)